MNYLQLAIDALECLKRRLSCDYDKFPDDKVRDRYNTCESGIQRIMALDDTLTRKSKEYYIPR